MTIYKFSKKITVSRTGRQYENTCEKCINLSSSVDKYGEDIIICNKYSAMKNMVRCIDFIEVK